MNYSRCDGYRKVGFSKRVPLVEEGPALPTVRVTGRCSLPPEARHEAP